jgi:hypothetical protein
MRVVASLLAFLAVPGAAFAADLSGTWNIVATIGGNPAEIRCTIVQRGDALTGTCKPAQFDPSALTGTASGTGAKWSYDVVFNGNPSHVEYEGVLGADGKLSGTLHLGPTPVAFTATRE